MNKGSVVIIGGGVSGLSAATVLAKRNIAVTVLEARDSVGGLASERVCDAFSFDTGPYILLDLPGLKWAFQEMNIPLESRLELLSLDPVFSVSVDGEDPLQFFRSLEQTASALQQRWPGSGGKYEQFVRRVSRVYADISPLRFYERPRPLDVVSHGGPRAVFFLLSSLAQILRQSGLPASVQRALGIWTYIAGQRLSTAPSPLAFVPALFHEVGAYYPRGGVSQVVAAIRDEAIASGVTIRTSAKVFRIGVEGARVKEVILEDQEVLKTQTIIAAINACAVYQHILDWHPPKRFQRFLDTLPMQSPGVMAYLAGKRVDGVKSPYLSFTLQGESCTALVQPGVLDNPRSDGWEPFRLIRPVQNATHAEHDSALREMLDGDLWRPYFDEVRVLQTLTPREWGSGFHLYRESMNPTMTPSFMRRGRFPHRCPFVKGLYFAGSSTHPGQWISFCSISGVLSAQAAIKDTLKC
jgi:phytoene dehydrogenase-like protein